MLRGRWVLIRSNVDRDRPGSTLKWKAIGDREFAVFIGAVDVIVVFYESRVSPVSEGIAFAIILDRDLNPEAKGAGCKHDLPKAHMLHPEGD